MASSETKEQAKGPKWALGSRARTLKAFGYLICALVVGASLFAFLAYREIGAQREHQLHLLDRAARHGETQIGLALGNVRNLRAEVGDDKKVEEFVRRQPFLDSRTKTPRTTTEPKSASALDCSRGKVELNSLTLPPSITIRDCSAGGAVRFDFEVGALMQDILPHGDFEGFLLVDAEGRQLTQLGSGSGPMLRTAADLSGDDLAGALGIEKLPVLRTVSHSLRVANLTIELSCQPLVVPTVLDDEGRVTERKTWTLCGAVSRNNLVRQAIILSPGWTSLFAVLALLGIAMMPYVKPVFMARRERLTRNDLVFLAVGTLLLLHVLTIVGFGTYRLLALRATDVAHLQTLADRVEATMLEDFRAHYEVLTQFDKNRCEAFEELSSEENESPPFADDEDFDDGVPRETLIFLPSAHDGDDSETVRISKDLGTAPPLFLSAFWLDEAGRQIHKITAREKNTAAVNVSHRGYFRHIRDGTGWPAELLDPGDPPHQVFIDTAFSITTSQPFFALSRPSRPRCEGNDKLRVAVLTGVLPAMESILSPAFGYAVIRADGGVVVSSHHELDPDDNFFTDLHDSRELRSVLASGGSHVLKLDLGRESHRLWIRPSLPCLAGECDAAAVPDGERWWIITYYDRELTSTLFGEVLTLAMGLSLLNCFAVGLITFALRKHLRAMIWPRRDQVYVYLRILLMLAAYLGLWAYFGSDLIDRWSHLDLGLDLVGLVLLALAPAVVPLLIVRVGFLGGKEHPDSLVVRWMSGRGVKRPDRWVYRIMLFTFWMSLGVVPAILFFQSAWEYDTVSLSRQEARWWHDETATRSQAIESEWANLADDCYLDARRASWSDRFPVFPFLPVCPASSTESADAAAECRTERAAVLHAGTGHALVPLARFLPAYNTTSGRLRYQWMGPVPEVGPELETRDQRTPESRRNAGQRAHWILTVVLLGLMAVIWSWIRFVSRHFTLRFFQRPDPGPELRHLVEETSQAAGQGPVGRRIVILTSNQHWSLLRQRDAFELVDLSTPIEAEVKASVDEPSPETHSAEGRTSAEGAPKAPKDSKAVEGPESQPARRPTVAVTGLARALADTELRTSAMSRLASLVESRRPILIFTGSDPWPVLAEAAAGHEIGEGAGIVDFGDARRWAGILSEFRTEYAMIDWQAMGEDRAQGDHWAIWWRCSDAEKLALLQLAQEGFLNPKQSTELDQLVRRNVLTLDDPKRPISYVDDKFCHFVQGAAASEHLLAWERKVGDREGWHGLRYAFAFFFVALFGFLFLVDPSLFDNLQALLAALAAFIPLSLGLLSRLQRPRD